jgi:superfamily I DNA/RNA helicase/mRNA-degrading endonuclease RelE of RelBE toxin-antitoxin system
MISRHSKSDADTTSNSMPRIVLRPSFRKDLDGLKRSARKQYERASEVLLELQRDVDPSVPRRAESRLPNCVKYELQDGYRLVLQKSDGSEDVLIALAIGKHDHVDSFLDGHKGWLFDPRKGQLRELRLATIDESAVEIVPSAGLVAEAVAVDEPIPPLFHSFSDEMLERLGVPPDLFASLRSLADPNGIDCMSVLQRLADVAPQASDLLLSYATGDRSTRVAVEGAARGEMTFLGQIGVEQESAVEASSEEFLVFNDPLELQHVLERGTLEQWQLFLHPDQRGLVERDFNGPARLRGISGSGKTVVALHRARRIAQSLWPMGQKVLFTTYDKGLAAAASRLLDRLCGPERAAIDVTHLHGWCLDYISFCGLSRPRFSTDESRKIREATVAALPPAHAAALVGVPPEYLGSEIEFLMGRFLHEETSQYLNTDRSGRGRPLSQAQRESVLLLYQSYHRRLFDAGFVEPAEFVRLALRRRIAGDPPESNYGAVIVDEVQDISEIGLRLLHSIVGNKSNGLLLVGDATQRIFTRGFSLRGLGIDIAGRGIVLRKNYRNTRQILEAAFPLVASEWDADLTTSGVNPADLRPEYSVREGHRPIVVRCPDEKAEGRFLATEIAALLRYKHYSPGDICILARNRHYRHLALTALQQAGIPVYEFTRGPTGDVTADEDAVRVSTLHGAKGHEFGAVFIAGAVEHVLPHSSAVESEAIGTEAALFYVGITRARDIVYVSHSERADGPRRLVRSSFIDRIKAHCDFALFNR